MPLKDLQILSVLNILVCIMPQPGTIIGDIAETFKEEGKKIVKEIASAPVDIVKASFEHSIPNPSQERTQQLKEEEKAKLAEVRSGLAMQAELASTPQPQAERGETKAEKGQTNQNAKMNDLQGQPTGLAANIKPKKKMEPLVVQQKRNNKLHGAG